MKMLQKALVVIKKPSFYRIVFLLAHICQRAAKKPNTNRLMSKKLVLNIFHLFLFCRFW